MYIYIILIYSFMKIYSSFLQYDFIEHNNHIEPYMKRLNNIELNLITFHQFKRTLNNSTIIINHIIKNDNITIIIKQNSTFNQPSLFSIQSHHKLLLSVIKDEFEWFDIKRKINSISW